MKLLCITILAVFLVPTFNVSSIPVRVEDAFFVGIILFSNVKPVLNQSVTNLIGLLFLFFLLNTLSLCVNILEGYLPSIQDVNTILSLFRNIVIFWAGLTIGRNINISINELVFSLSLGAFFSSAVSIIQFFDVFGLGEFFYLLYGREETMEYGITRAVGVLGNPNYAAFFQTIGLVSLLCTRIPSGTLHKAIYFVGLGLVIVSIFVTFSRTGLIGIICVLIGHLVLRRHYKVLIFTSVILMVAIMNYSKIMEGTRYARVVDESGDLDVTLSGRSTLIWDQKLEEFYNNVLFGTGPGKNLESNTIFSITIFDNSFIYLLVTSGLIGTSAYFLFFYFVMSYFSSRKSRFPSMYSFLVLFYLIVFIYFITTDLVRAVHFNSYFYFTIGIFMIYIHNLKTTKYNVAININPNSKLESR